MSKQDNSYLGVNYTVNESSKKCELTIEDKKDSIHIDERGEYLSQNSPYQSFASADAIAKRLIKRDKGDLDA